MNNLDPLITYEMINSTADKKKQKDLAPKASPHENDNGNFEEEEVALFSCKFKSFLTQIRKV